MRTSGLDLRRLIFVIVLLLLPVAVSPSSVASSISASRPAEQWVLQQARNGKPANLKDKFTRETDRVVGASFLKQVLTSDPARTGIRAYGIRISHARVLGELDLTNEEIPYYVTLDDCFFDEDLTLVNAHFKKSLHLERSVFECFADLRYLVIDGDLEARGVQFDLADLEPLDKDGKLRPMSFEGMKVGGPLFLSRAVFKRPVNFYAAQIGGNFVADDEAHFESDAVFELMKIGARAVFDKAKFDGRTSFYSVKVAENFDASEAYFNDTKHGVIFEGMSVDAALFSGSHFKGPARFYGMTASSSLDLSGVDFYKVTEDMATDDQAKNDKITAFVNFQGMAIKGSFFLRRSIFNRGVSFYGTSVDREFSADAAQFNDPQSGVFFNNLKTDTIGLSGAVFRGPISLSGVTYREVDRDSLDNLVSVIRQANYDAGAYFELEAYYRTHGAISQADDVYIEQRRRERRGLWFPARWSEALFVDLPLGYGRHIWRLIVPSAILIGIGCYVFRSKELMEPQAPEYACRHYSRFLYSLGLFLPIVDLRSDVWLPKHERRAARRYLPFHIIAGWVLVTLLVGALTGILK